MSTLFIPDNPITRPRLSKTEELEDELPVQQMVEEAIDRIEKEEISGADMDF